jgi:uncharacterized membrane protein
MNTIINAITLIIAFLHLNFLMLEMFFWTRPYGLKVFGQRLHSLPIKAFIMVFWPPV